MQVLVSYIKHVSFLPNGNEMLLIVLASRDKGTLSCSARHIVGWGWVLIKIWIRMQKFQGTEHFLHIVLIDIIRTIGVYHSTIDVVSFWVNFTPLKFHHKDASLRVSSKGVKQWCTFSFQFTKSILLSYVWGQWKKKNSKHLYYHYFCAFRKFFNFNKLKTL